MYHVGYGTYLVHSVKHYDRLRGVRHADSNTFSRFNAYSGQRSCALVHFRNKIFVFYLSAHKIISNVIRIVFGHLCYLVVH